MRLVLVESPYAGDVEANVTYARQCLADCLSRGEAPFASHLLYTQPDVLNDDVPAERSLGINAGLEWGRRADVTAVYVDRGISSGMRFGLIAAEDARRPIEFRTLAKTDVFLLRAAEVVRALSLDPSTTCGCVIVDRFGSCTFGWNDFPQVLADHERAGAWREVRHEKYDRTIHAEVAATLSAPAEFQPFGSTAYITGPACKACALHLIAFGVRRVVWPKAGEAAFAERWAESLARARELFADAGVQIDAID